MKPVPTRPGLVMLWSAPRCRSTAFERMMVARGDFTVVHEPFSHLADFGTATVAGRPARSAAAVKSALRELARTRPVFVKDTTDFRYPEVSGDAGFLRAAVHTFLIRDPAAAIVSHHRLNPALRRDEVGFDWLHEIFVAARAATGRVPLVVDADDLVDEPERVVAGYCRHVRIPFCPEALRWRPSMLPQWERTARWHVAASESTGFRNRRDPGPFPADATLRSYLDYHRPFYTAMRAACISGAV